MDDFISVQSTAKFVELVCFKVYESSKKWINEEGKFSLVLSGGRTPRLIFEHLFNSYAEKIDWSKTHFFWVDERCVSPDHVDSNFNLANNCLISRLNAVGSIHRMKGELDPNDAAREYKKEIALFFKTYRVNRFDLVLLGMGEDGHVASIFPNSKELEKRGEVTMGTEKLQKGYVRVTLGLDIINATAQKILLVNTAKKRQILASQNITYPVNHVLNKTVVVLNDS